MTTTTAATRAPLTVIGFLGRLLSPRFKVSVTVCPDYCTTRHERTRNRLGVELERYEDGTGFEVAALGCLVIVGAEAKRHLALAA